MKKRILFSGFLVALFAIGSRGASAYVVELPQGAVGVSPEVFAELQDARCSYEQLPGMIKTPSGGNCDPVIAPLENKVIFRADTGAMYWINTGDGLPFVNRYLPNGFYQTKEDGKTRYYWVVDGFRMKFDMSKDADVYAQVLSHIQNTPRYSVIPVSEKDFAALQASQEAAQGPTALERRLAGSVIMRVEGDGSLYVISPDGYILSDFTAKNVRTLIQDFSVPVKHSLMKQVISWKRL